MPSFGTTELERGRHGPVRSRPAPYISTVSARAANPFGSILARAVVLAIPAVVVFAAFQRHFVQSNLGSGVKG